MSCTRTSHKCYHDPYSMQSMPECCYNHLVQVIHYLTELLTEKKITYWISFGTLLGAVRNGKIIPWDSDADICVLSEDKEKIYQLKNRIESDGYCFFEYYKNLLQIGYSAENWSYCDIWFYEKTTAREHGGNPNGQTLDYPLDISINSDEPILFCDVPWMQVNHTCDFPYWFVKKLKQIKLEGKLVNCPRFTNKFVELIYGPEWRKPEPKYNGQGHYYPLSKWLEFTKNKNNMQCRQDTINCQEINKCCLNHIKELISYTTQILETYDIQYEITNSIINIEKTSYAKILELSEEINKSGYIINIEDNSTLKLYYSQTNKNKITLNFKSFYIENSEFLKYLQNAYNIIKFLNPKRTDFKYYGSKIKLASYLFDIHASKDFDVFCIDNQQIIYENCKKGSVIISTDPQREIPKYIKKTTCKGIYVKVFSKKRFNQLEKYINSEEFSKA